ncbi:MAG: lytic transglycosylase domain-containing protein [Desulfohalobiaceae bacterium]
MSQKLVFTVLTVLLAAAFFCFGSELVWAEDIYYHKDEHGVMHFTDMPPDQSYKPFFSQDASRPDQRRILAWVRKYSRFYGLEPELVQAVMEVESSYQARAVSRAGAQGLMQIMPGTQRYLGLESAFDPESNIEAGVRYLGQLWQRFPPKQALAAYNAGPSRVKDYQGVPPFPETQAYVQKVLEVYSSLKNKQNGP